jgi:hypothetical protein
MTVFQIKRTPTPGNSPPPLSLFEGELAVDMAEPVAPRLWVGVPASIDPTGMRLVSDMSQSASDLVNWSVTETGSVPDAYTIIDTVNAVERLVIAQSQIIGGVPPTVVEINARGSLTIGADLNFLGITNGPRFGAGANYFDAFTGGTGRFNWWDINGQLASLDSVGFFVNGRITAQDRMYAQVGVSTPDLFDVDSNLVVHFNSSPGGVTPPTDGFTSYYAENHIFYSRPDLTVSTPVEYGHWDATGLHLYTPFVMTGLIDAAGNESDATISLSTSAQTWDLIAQEPGSNAAGMFTIADATLGTRRLNIHSGSASAPIELLATGELLLALDPTDPMGAVTKQYVDALTSAGGLINWSVTEAGSVPGAYTITDTLATNERFVIEPYAPNPIFPGLPIPAPMTILPDGSLSVGGNEVSLDGTPGRGISVDLNNSSMKFNATRVQPGFNITSYEFADVNGQPMAFISESSTTPGLATLHVHQVSTVNFSEGYINISSSGDLKFNNGRVLNRIDSPGGAGNSINSDVQLWSYTVQGAPPNTGFPSIIVHSEIGGTALGHNSYHADVHNFRSRDGLTEYVRIDSSGITVGGLPIGASGGVTVSDTPPASPTNGSLWFDSVSMRMCMWYDDGTSQQWITI